MKKQAILRGLLGFPLGVFISYAITIVISLISGNGTYFSVVPALVDEMGSEIGAVVLQFVLCGALGAAYAVASVSFEVESWSITKMTVMHFAILSLSMFPIAYFMHWMERSVVGMLSYFGIFIGIYIAIWCGQYFGLKSKLKKINSVIEQKK